EPKKTMLIITDKVEEVRAAIIDDLERGATLIPGKGMYMGQERDIIYVVLSKREMLNLRYRIAKIDPRAFINVVNSSEILGEGFKEIDSY
ncbi:MAG: YitT family protein, partial [Bacteroidales bacterium]|nr:YitT family protein [Bacteroidales bacterium]